MLCVGKASKNPQRVSKKIPAANILLIRGECSECFARDSEYDAPARLRTNEADERRTD
jgi:hypothetical protein